MSDANAHDGRPLVLVADDDDDILALVRFRLERSGYDVIEARDGGQAVEAAARHLPDVAILDVMMPRMDGFEVTRRLRAEEATRDLPIILLTARVQEKDVEQGFAAGATDYMRKPFSPQELRARVGAAIGRR